MVKKELLSLVAASLLAATLTGCGNSCRPGTDCTPTPDANGNSTIDANMTLGSSDITATAPAYVLEANLLKGTEAYNTSNSGTYTWNNTVLADFSSSMGAVDTNENGMADAEDPKAPDMKAKAGYTNINPFTTLEANGLTVDEINSHYGIALESTDIDLSTADLNVYQAAAKVTLELAYTQGNPDGNKCNSTGCLLNPMQVAPCVPYELIVCDSNPSTTNGNDAVPQALKDTFSAIDATTDKGSVNRILKDTLGAYAGFYAADNNATN